jgi:hypothetical protein
MGKTPAEAVEKANEELARWESGLDRDAGNKTLAQFLSEFLAPYKRDGGIAPSACRDYRSTLSRTSSRFWGRSH